MGQAEDDERRLTPRRLPIGTPGPARVAGGYLGFILWPCLITTLSHSRSPRLPQELTGHARRQARVAAAVSLLALAVFLVLCCHC